MPIKKVKMASFFPVLPRRTFSFHRIESLLIREILLETQTIPRCCAERDSMVDAWRSIFVPPNSATRSFERWKTFVKSSTICKATEINCIIHMDWFISMNLLFVRKNARVPIHRRQTSAKKFLNSKTSSGENSAWNTSIRLSGYPAKRLFSYENKWKYFDAIDRRLSWEMVSLLTFRGRAHLNKQILTVALLALWPPFTVRCLMRDIGRLLVATAVVPQAPSMLNYCLLVINWTVEAIDWEKRNNNKQTQSKAALAS